MDSRVLLQIVFSAWRSSALALPPLRRLPGALDIIAKISERFQHYECDEEAG